VAGLDPAIHAFPRLGRTGFQDVDGRIKSNKSGQVVLLVVFAFRIAVLKLLQRLNRIAVDLVRPSTSRF
jgi:hypothetical protein